MFETEMDRPSTTALKIRQTVVKNYSLILIVLVVAGGIGGWAGYTAYFDPEVETEERTTSTWSRTATFTHGAEVTRPNPIYSTGRRLTDQRAYFPRISPFLEGEYQFSYTASGGGNVEVVTELRLLVRRGEGDIWQSTRTLQSSRAVDIGPNREIISTYRFNMNQVRDRLDRVSDTLGETPGQTDVVIRAETRMTGEINGRQVDRRFVDDLRLVPDGDAFLVSDPGQISNNSAQTGTIQREQEYSLLWKGGAALLIIVGFVGAGGLVYWRRKGALTLTVEERERLSREEYSEWVSYGTLPQSFDPDDDELVELESLGDLVDIAADINDRVLYDSEYNCYAVLDEGYNYVYWPMSVARTEAAEPAQTQE